MSTAADIQPLPTPPAPGPPVYMRPGYLASAGRIFDLSLGEMLWSRRTIFMALVVGGPVLIAAFVRFLAGFGFADMKMDSVRISGTTIFGMMIWLFYVRFTVPVLAVFYGTALIADEVEDKTITYLFTRPVPRGAVLVGKYLAYLVCTILVVLPSVMLVYLLVVPIGGTLGEAFIPLIQDLGILALGLVVYGALFALVGAQLKRPLLTGLIWVIGWEPVALLIPVGYLKNLTIAYYLQGLVPHAMPQDSAMSMIQSMFRESPSLVSSLTALFVITALCLFLAARAVERREYVLEQ